MDQSLVVALYAWANANPVLTLLTVALAQAGLFLLPLALVLLWLWPSPSQLPRRQAALASALAGFLAVLLVLVLEHLFSRPRPFVQATGRVKLDGYTDRVANERLSDLLCLGKSTQIDTLAHVQQLHPNWAVICTVVDPSRLVEVAPIGVRHVPEPDIDRVSLRIIFNLHHHSLPWRLITNGDDRWWIRIGRDHNFDEAAAGVSKVNSSAPDPWPAVPR